MILKKYELMYILRPDMSEDKTLSLVHSYKRIIKQHGGQNIFVEYKGRRRLSYNISSYYDGIYVQIDYDGTGYLINLIEKSMRLNVDILRYLTVKKN